MFILQNNFNVKIILVQELNQCDLDCLHINAFCPIWDGICAQILDVTYNLEENKPKI
jgi:hypothetical protein